MTAPRATVTGLRELQAELKAAGGKLPRELTKGHKEAGQVILEPAQEAMASSPVPKADEAAAGMRVRAQQRSIAIALLGANPFVRAHEFGTLVHHVFGRPVLARTMRRPVFLPWLGNDEGAGYALYPTIREKLPSAEFAAAYYAALDRVYARAFPEGSIR